MFWIIWLIGAAFVFTEGAFAYHDGFLTQAQIAQYYQYPKAYSFMEHGGMWCDVIIVNYLVALIISKYHLAYGSWFSLGFIIVGTVIVLFMNHKYNTGWLIIPEAGMHDGKVTTMGKTHGFYALITIWIIFLFYFCPVGSDIEKRDLVKVCVGLLVLCVVGTMKFNGGWHFRPLDFRNIGIVWAVLIGVSWYKYQHLLH